MARTTWMLTLALAAACLALLAAGPATAQSVVVLSPGADCYVPQPAVSSSSPPAVYTPAPQVSYYTPSVSYYAVPSVSYYTPSVSYYAPVTSYYAAPSAVTTTTRYGLFGRPRVSTTRYYP